MIDIVINESPISHVSEYDAIIVGTNCYQSMRNGFQGEVAKRYKYVLESNYKTRYADNRKLGTIVETDDSPKFILAFITFGLNFKGGDKEYLDYEALGKCLRLINILYKGKHLATTMLGTTKYDGNGDRDKVLEMFNKEIKDLDLTIYDYRQESFNEMNQKVYFENLKKRKCRKIV